MLRKRQAIRTRIRSYFPRACLQQQISIKQITKEKSSTQDIGHLVFEILCRYQRIQELLATFEHGVDFTAATSQVLVVVESFPKIINRLVTWLGTSIDEHTDLRLCYTTIRLCAVSNKAKIHLQHIANSVEEPAVRVDFLLVLCLENENDLDRHQVIRIVWVRKDKLGRGIDRELCGVLYENKFQNTIYKLARTRAHLKNVRHGI